MSLTAEQIRFFDDYGYLTGLDIHDQDEVTRIRQAFDELEAREGKETSAIGLAERHFHERFIWEIASHPTILNAIEALIGTDIMVLSTHFFCKYPSATKKFVAWHQDVTYWGLEPPVAVTAWYAVDDSDVENGCMRVIPGSHRQGILEHGKSGEPGNLLSVNQSIQGEVDENQAMDIVLEAGQISIHHGQLIHGSNPNQSNRRRCGLTLRYCPSSVKPVQNSSVGKTWQALLVRGEDRQKNFGQWQLQFS